MLLINIHHYIMGLAGSARAGGEEPGRRRTEGVGGGSQDRPAAGGGGSGFLSGGQKRGGERSGRSQMRRGVGLEEPQGGGKKFGEGEGSG